MAIRLFLRELGRSMAAGTVFWTVMALFAAAGEQLAVQRAITRGDAEEASSVLLLLLWTASGMVWGERTFSRDIKERHVVFLFSLPVSRGAVWAALVGARLTASLSGLFVLWLLRPGFARFVVSAGVGRMNLPTCLGVFFISFALGLTLTLCLRQALATYLTSAAMLIVLCVEVPVALSFPNVPAELLVGDRGLLFRFSRILLDVDLGLQFPLVPIGFVIAPLAFIIFSRASFAGFEPGLQRSRVVRLAGALGLCLLLVGTARLGGTLAGPWLLAQDAGKRDTVVANPTSGDIVVVTLGDEAAQIASLSFRDLPHGRVRRQRDVIGLFQSGSFSRAPAVAWRTEDGLGLLRDRNSPTDTLGYRGGGSEWIAFDREGRRLGSRRFPGRLRAAQSRATDWLAVTQVGHEGVLWSVGRKGSRQLARAPLAGHARIAAVADDTHLVAFLGPSNPPQTWSVRGEEVREEHFPAHPGLAWDGNRVVPRYDVLRGYGRPPDAPADVQVAFSAPRVNGTEWEGPWGSVFLPKAQPVIGFSFDCARRRAAAYWVATEGSDWRQLANDLVMPPDFCNPDTVEGRSDLWQHLPEFHVQVWRGRTDVLVYCDQRDRCFLFDASLSEPVALGKGLAYSFGELPGGNELLVAVRHEQGGTCTAQLSRYSSASGLRPAGRFSCTSYVGQPVAEEPDGSLLLFFGRVAPGRPALVRLPPQGEPTTIWSW